MFINYLRINLIQYKQDRGIRSFLLCVLFLIHSVLLLVVFPAGLEYNETGEESVVLGISTIFFAMIYIFIGPLLLSFEGTKQVCSYYGNKIYTNIEPALRNRPLFCIAQILVHFIPAVEITVFYYFGSHFISIYDWENSFIKLYPFAYRASVLIVFISSLGHLLGVHFWAMLFRSRLKAFVVHIAIHGFMIGAAIYMKHHFAANIAEFLYPTFIPLLNDTPYNLNVFPDDFYGPVCFLGTAVKLIATTVLSMILFNRSKESIKISEVR